MNSSEELIENLWNKIKNLCSSYEVILIENKMLYDKLKKIEMKLEVLQNQSKEYEEKFVEINTNNKNIYREEVENLKSEVKNLIEKIDLHLK